MKWKMMLPLSYTNWRCTFFFHLYYTMQYMKILKRYMKNPYQLQASSIERYIVNEVVEFYIDNLLEVEVIGFHSLVVLKTKLCKKIMCHIQESCQHKNLTLRSSVGLDVMPIMLVSISYFGIAKEIRVIDYVKFGLFVFICNNNDVQTKELRFTLVDLNRVGYREKFYHYNPIETSVYDIDPSNEKWFVVLQARKKNEC
ncbi:hypothetical protein CR513_54418, partial [Mucuna pruriens]